MTASSDVLTRVTAPSYDCPVNPAKVAAALAAIAALSVPFAGIAHADDQSFIQLMQSEGVPITGYTPYDPLAMGRFVCEDLRAGIPLDQAAHLELMLYPFRQQVLDAAPRELCPDALHG